jgi:hypothetical protein
VNRNALVAGMLLLVPSAALAQIRTDPAGTRPGLSEAPRPGAREGSILALDAGERPIRTLESGSTLHVAARGLLPGTLYEFRVGLERGSLESRERGVSFARVMTDARGAVPSFVLWYESGVVGCATRRNDAPDPRRFRFRDFDEAERALAGQTLVVSAHRVPLSRPTPGHALEVTAGPAQTVLQLPVVRRRSPMVYVSNAEGCLLNAQEAGRSDVYITGRNFVPGEALEVALAPNRRAWYVGDLIVDVTRRDAGRVDGGPRRAVAGADGRFTVPAWRAADQVRGAFDVVAHRLPAQGRTVGPRDIVSFAHETGFVLYLLYPPGGSQMDVAGRMLLDNPWFEFADAFARTGDAVWAAVDPTYVPAAHPGGTWAGYYVVNHRTGPQWVANTSLADVSGGVEVHPVKGGCINMTDVIIWNSPLSPGEYDVVVEFGSTAASSGPTYVPDFNYHGAVDFLDGAGQVGFTVADDPYALGPYPVGTDSYSQDDFFPTLGSASAVDLRAVIRYPATVAGAGTPAAPGTHPLFVIQHGNHYSCLNGAPHASCPPAMRVKNHEGYTHLLDVLASHGVIAVSIDAFDLTGWVPPWIPERGALILKHLELWSHLNNAAAFPAYPGFFAGRFAGKVDMSRIAVSGHSRGGEASVSAWLQNAALAIPFSIVAVSSIAPTDFSGYTLGNVPYFVILPAADGDVFDLAGQRIYDRAGGTSDAITKSLINVYGANHNFFNTVWAADPDDSSPTRQYYIAAPSQQTIGEAYLAAFHRSALRGEAVYDDVFRGGLTFPSYAGYRIYSTRHESSHVKLLGGAVPTAGGTALLAGHSNPSPHSTQVTRMAWASGTATATYTLPLAERNATGFEVLSFRVAQTWTAVAPLGQQFWVELVGNGITRGMFTGQFDAIPPPYLHPYGSQHTVMSTVRIPLHSFIINVSGLPLNNIDTVRFRFQNPTSGEIYVDDVEFSR